MTGALVSGTQYVYGSATNATVFSGGLQEVQFGGIVSGTVVSGGIVEVVSGGTVDTITFKTAGGTLQIDGPNAPGNLLPGATVSGFVSGDTIDLTGSLTTAPAVPGSMAATQLLIAEGGDTYELQLTGDFTGDYFHLSFDNGGIGPGTLVTENTTPPCYCPGTLIRTPRGQKKIEQAQDRRQGDDRLGCGAADQMDRAKKLWRPLRHGAHGYSAGVHQSRRAR